MLIQQLNYSQFRSYDVKPQQQLVAANRTRNRKFETLGSNSTALPNLHRSDAQPASSVHHEAMDQISNVIVSSAYHYEHERKPRHRSRVYEPNRFKSLLNSENNATGRQSVKNLLQVFSPTEHSPPQSVILPALSPQNETVSFPAATSVRESLEGLPLDTQLQFRNSHVFNYATMQPIPEQAASSLQHGLKRALGTKTTTVNNKERSFSPIDPRDLRYKPRNVRLFNNESKFAIRMKAAKKRNRVN